MVETCPIRRKLYLWENSPFGREPWSVFYEYAKQGGDTLKRKEKEA